MSRLDRRCRVCRKNFQDCPHSIADEAQREADDRVRAIVRDEMQKIREEQSKTADLGIELAACGNCLGEILSSTSSRDPWGHGIWLHVSSGGTYCHRKGYEQTHNLSAVPLPEVAPITQPKPKPRAGQYRSKRVGLGTHPEGLDDL